MLEAIKTFEVVSGQKLNYKIRPRRPGDVKAIYANNNKAVQVLNWQIKYDLTEMIRTAWNWGTKGKARRRAAKGAKRGLKLKIC